MNKPVNPFNPSAPIEPTYFAGRKSELQLILRALQQTSSGSQQNVLITGERGIGKSSLALWGRYIAQQPNVLHNTNFAFATAYYTLDENDSIATFCHGLVKKLHAQLKSGLSDRFFEKIKQLDCSIKLDFWFGSTEIAAKKGNETSKIREDFVKILEELWNEIRSDYHGMLLIVDEVNKIDKRENLGAFFKKVSEDLVSDGFRSIMFCLVGLPWIEDKIFEDDSSAACIFSHVVLGPMASSEASEVIGTALANTGISIEDRARTLLIDWSGGYPYFLQRMCFDSFEINSDDQITSDDVIMGVSESLTQFDRAFFGRVLRELEGKNYQKIIETLSDCAEGDSMTASQMEKRCKVRNVAQYLPKLQKDGIVASPRKGRYELSSPVFKLYVQIERQVGRWKKDSLAGSLPPS